MFARARLLDVFAIRVDDTLALMRIVVLWFG